MVESTTVWHTAGAFVPLDKAGKQSYNVYNKSLRSIAIMKRILSLNTRDLATSKKEGGCGECQTSCQSACKTSCGVANQKCEKSAK